MSIIQGLKKKFLGNNHLIEKMTKVSFYGIQILNPYLYIIHHVTFSKKNPGDNRPGDVY